jgi:hypothetical protein
MLDSDTRSNAIMTVTPARATSGSRLLSIVTICGLLGLVGAQIGGFGPLLPLTAALLVAGGFAIAAIAWLTGARRHDNDLTSWDVAGVLTFLGFAAGMIAS